MFKLDAMYLVQVKLIHFRCVFSNIIHFQVSAYSSFARMATRVGKVGQGLEHQRRRMDTTTNEPLFTNCTRDFLGTLDYVFYTGKSCGYFNYIWFCRCILMVMSSAWC